MKNIKLIALLVCLTVVVCSLAGCAVSDIPVIGQLFVKTAPLTFEPNGGTITDEVVPEAYSDNAALALPAASLQYYSFLGWSFNEDGSGDLYTELPEKFELTEEQIEFGIVLYAVWERLTGTITYELAGGAWAEGDEPDAIYLYGEELELLEPEREFFEFEGWQLGDKVIDKISEDQEGDVSLVATWVQVETQISYDLGVVKDIVTVKEALPDAHETFDTDKGADLSEAEYIPTAPGHLFSGWYADAELTQAITSIPKNTTEPVTIYAKWVATPVIDGEHWVGVK